MRVDTIQPILIITVFGVLVLVTVLSLGIRGDASTAEVERARALLEKHLAEGGWKRAGEFRMMGYNSPMVPSARRFWEIQVPVTR